MASNWRTPYIPRLRDRERAAGHLLGVSLLLAGGRGERLALRADLAQAQGVGVVEHRDDQAPFERDGDPDVDLAVPDDRVGLERGVHAGVPPQGQRHGLGHEVAERELDLLGGELLVQLLADRDDLVDPDVDGDVDLGGGLLRLDHPAGDRLAHPGVRDALGGARGRGGRAAAAGRPARARPLRLRLEEGLDVAADRPGRRGRCPGPGRGRPGRRRDLAGQRARLDPAASARRPLAVGRGCRLGLLEPSRLLAVGVGRVAPRAAGGSSLGCSAERALRPAAELRPAPCCRPTLGDRFGVLALLGQDQDALAQGDLVAFGHGRGGRRSRRRTTSSASSALSVSMSASMSPSLTWSPTLTSHLTICPLSIVGLSLAIVTSIGTGSLLRAVRRVAAGSEAIAVSPPDTDG